MLEVKASFVAFAFGVRSCRASVCRQVRVVAFPLLDCAAVDSVQSALIYPERLRGRRTMTAPLSTRRSLALGPRMSLALFAVALLMLPAWPSSASAASLKSLKDLSGKTLGVQQGGASFQVLPELEVELKKTGGKLGNVVQYGAFSEAYQDLVNRRLDAVIHNIVSLSTLVSEKPDVFEFGQRVGRKSYAAWAVQKNNKSLVDFLNAFLAQQKSNGTYKQLQSQWLRIMFDDLPNQPLLPGDRPIK